jgi:hypothetical protein
MGVSRRFGAISASLALLTASAAHAGGQKTPVVAPAATAAAPAEKQGSLYLQCDGQPNNVTGGETAARLLGAVTLLALFAPQPEAADASKRKFGADGVAACSAMIDGEKKEGNAKRRIHLILGRAIHQIEAKNYPAAIADAALARQEMIAGGFMADPYYARSQGRAPDLIESAALYREGKAPEAREAALRDMPTLKHNFIGLASVPAYTLDARTGSDAETAYIGWRTRSAATSAGAEANRLEELGRFGDAAKVRDALADFDAVNSPEINNSVWIAEAAVTQALAGNLTAAAAHAKAAQDNFDKRKADGKPEASASEFVELMDLYGIIRTAASGDVKTARRLFAARSQWVAASFGSVVEVTRRLRTGASAEETIGGLSRDAETMWKDRDAAERAAVLAHDSDNKTLFYLIPYAPEAASYEAQSKAVWQTAKSKILIVPKKPRTDGNRFETLMLYPLAASIGFDAYQLHAALLAKSRGQQGFVMFPILQGGFVAAGIVTGNRGEPGLADALFNDAETVIADLTPIIPDPEVVKARHAAAGH